MAVKRIIECQPRGTYGPVDIWLVEPLAGAVGGSPHQTPPFTGPAATAVGELASAGVSGALGVDEGTGYAHVYVQPCGQVAVEQQEAPVFGAGLNTNPNDPPKETTAETGETDPWTPKEPEAPKPLYPETGTPPIVPAPPPPNELSLGGLVSGISGALGVCEAEGWATVQDAQQALRQSGKDCIGFIDRASFGALTNRLANPPIWAYRDDDGKWKAPLNLCPDTTVQIVAGSMVCSATATRVNGATGGGSMGMDLIGTPPSTYTVRKCGKGKVLAIDGLCYWKRLLPAALRANKSRKAPVSWSDYQSIKKGERAAQRIKKYEKAIVKNARRMVPPKRRAPRRPPQC